MSQGKHWQMKYLNSCIFLTFQWASLGYDETDIDELAKGTLPQHVTKLSPRQPVELDELRQLFRDALDG
ncbi:hypothetical protein ACHAXN_008323 [Cyclotella atomus]|jgi:alcohol dehydrogenase class IV